jgi:hypothetical protein
METVFVRRELATRTIRCEILNSGKIFGRDLNAVTEEESPKGFREN